MNPRGIALTLQGMKQWLPTEKTKAKNPIVWLKQLTELTDDEIGRALGIPLHIVRQLKWGCLPSLPPECAERLKKAGYPGDPARDYEAWREEATAECTERIREAFESWKRFQEWRARESKDSDSKSD